MTPAGRQPQAPQQSFLKRNRKAVVIGSLGVVASTFLVCGAQAFTRSRNNNAYDAYCVDQNTGNRTDDDDCDPSYRSSGYATGGHYYWYHVPSRAKKPAVGAKASGGSYSVPARGGFGSSGKSGSSGG